MTVKKLTYKEQDYSFISLGDVATKQNKDIRDLPFVKRILLENVIRNNLDLDDNKEANSIISNGDKGLNYYPSRIILQDLTGVPVICDLVALKAEAEKAGLDPELINPVIDVDLVVDHSVQIDSWSSKDSLSINSDIEFKRNEERYKFFKWAMNKLSNFNIVPPGMGIVHQINVEYFGKVVAKRTLNNQQWLLPDSCVGTDSHTTMINGLATLAWGVGGLEAEIGMLGQALPLSTPKVVGVKLTGELKSGVFATDIALHITNKLRQVGVVGTYVEYYGESVKKLSIADRTTIANMAPEYGATTGFFPIDEQTIKFLEQTGREHELVQIWAKEAGFWQDYKHDPTYDTTIEIALNEVRTSVAGPKRPQDKLSLSDTPQVSRDEIIRTKSNPNIDVTQLSDGSIGIASITSCTNTSNPYVLIAAALLAKNATKYNLKIKPWVKTSFAPGSRVVEQYLKNTDLLKELENVGFHIVAFGCTTCIGNSGPLKPEIEQQIKDNNLQISSVLSGNRNFEGRIHPLIKQNYLANPALVVAYAIAGNTTINLETQALGTYNGTDIYLKDIMPSNNDIEKYLDQTTNPELYKQVYNNVFKGTPRWQELQTSSENIYEFSEDSTYLQLPPLLQLDNHYIKQMASGTPISGFNTLFFGGDSITTDHISPAGSIALGSPAAKYLQERNVEPLHFNSYGSRRGNHNIMIRGTFANIRLKNNLANKEGGYTTYIPTKEEMTIYDASMKYQKNNTPLIIFAGKEYGSGSSRDWAAKGAKLLGISVVVAKSFERIHRSNLVAMAVLPLQLKDSSSQYEFSGDVLINAKDITVTPPDKGLNILSDVLVTITTAENKIITLQTTCRIDTAEELKWVKNAGVLKSFLLSKAP